MFLLSLLDLELSLVLRVVTAIERVVFSSSGSASGRMELLTSSLFTDLLFDWCYFTTKCYVPRSYTFVESSGRVEKLFEPCDCCRMVPSHEGLTTAIAPFQHPLHTNGIYTLGITSFTAHPHYILIPRLEEYTIPHFVAVSLTLLNVSAIPNCLSSRRMEIMLAYDGGPCWADTL